MKGSGTYWRKADRAEKRERKRREREARRAAKRAEWLALEADAVRRMLAGESGESGRQSHS